MPAHNPSNRLGQAARPARRRGDREQEVVEALNTEHDLAAFSAGRQRSGAEESFEEVHDFGLARQILDHPL
jgi:hypothetical protein